MMFPLNETLTMEFKSDVKSYPMDKLVHELIGMANAEGGKLFLGIEDDGTVTGVNIQHRNVISLIAFIKENTIPPIAVSAWCFL